jgi:hypothetical protein
MHSELQRDGIHAPAALASVYRPSIPAECLGGFHNLSQRFAVPGIETLALGSAECNIVTISTELCK